VQKASSEELLEVPSEPEVTAYGTVDMHSEASLMDNLDQLSITQTGAPIASERPMPMEQYGLAFGMLAYRSVAQAKCVALLELLHVQV
jgi:hypothetical protein